MPRLTGTPEVISGPTVSLLQKKSDFFISLPSTVVLIVACDFLYSPSVFPSPCLATKTLRLLITRTPQMDYPNRDFAIRWRSESTVSQANLDRQNCKLNLSRHETQAED
jgi:hypothetical protein